MTIEAKVIADSVSPDGFRLTTMQLRYPKFIHGEAKTHRLFRIGDKAYESLEEVGFMDYPEFSRNASSSRAIPVERMIEDVLRDPVIPVFWGKNQSGMSAAEEHDALISVPTPSGGCEDLDRLEAWLYARDRAIELARSFAESGYHKQIVNRLIEPWCHINVVVSATEWANFFALRVHSAAQPEMRLLAEAMRDARAASTPTLLQPGEWHLPYVKSDEFLPTVDRIKLSIARCARVSYLTHEGKPPNVEDDLKLYERLVGSEPLHASPAEHQATPDSRIADHENDEWVWRYPHEHGNFVGWRQFRKTLPNESVRDR